VNAPARAFKQWLGPSTFVSKVPWAPAEHSDSTLHENAAACYSTESLGTLPLRFRHFFLRCWLSKRPSQLQQKILAFWVNSFRTHFFNPRVVCTLSMAYPTVPRKGVKKPAAASPPEVGAVLACSKENSSVASRRKRRLSRRWTYALVALGCMLFPLILLKFATWYPGDETIRAASEGALRLMLSRGGFSVGKYNLLHFRAHESHRHTTPETEKFQVQTGTGSAVSRDVLLSAPPQWASPLDIRFDARAKLEADTGKCFFRIDDQEVLLLYDMGNIVHYDLASILSWSLTEVTVASEPNAPMGTGLSQKCTHFTLTERILDGEHPRAPPTILDGSAGRVVLLRSATSIEMLKEYRRALLNHQAFAEHHGYALVLSIVTPDALSGRSGKFAKHLSLGVHAAAGSFDTLCHLDLDAWFSSWGALSSYTDQWPQDKDIMFGDTGQVWLNSGLICVRPTHWAASYFESVTNAAHHTSRDGGLPPAYLRGSSSVAIPSVVSGEGNHPAMSFGFKRDQPAVWHVLMQMWTKSVHVSSYKGSGCSAWKQCNPDEDTLECWHECFWEALLRIENWEGLHSINSLPHVHLMPRAVDGSSAGGLPPIHRMCLRSCRSALSLAAMGTCTALTGGQHCFPGLIPPFPPEAQHVSACDGRGCLKQMLSGGGAWLKHTGHKYWTSTLRVCIPTTIDEARAEQEHPEEFCNNAAGGQAVA